MAALTLSILLSNVLAIAFAGLFSPSTLSPNGTTLAHTYPKPVFQQVFTESAVEMYYILSSYHSGATSLDPPPWVMPEYYVLPVDLKTPDGMDQYHVDTLGIGLDIQCAVIPRNLVLIEWPGHLNSSEKSSNCPPYPYRSEYPLVTILNDTCVPQDRHFMDWVGWVRKTDDAIGPSDLNSFDTLTPSNICPGTFYAG